MRIDPQKTQREREVLLAIERFQKAKGYSPSYMDIALELGVSKSRIAQVINALTIKRLVTKEGIKGRTLQLCK